MKRKLLLVGLLISCVALLSGPLVACSQETPTATSPSATTPVATTPAATTPAATTPTNPTTSGVTLEILNPRGEVDPPPSQAPNPRIDTLDGKKIALYWNSKENGNVFWDEIEILLKAKYPTVTVLRYNGGFDIGDTVADKVKADGADAFMYGMGD
jgi:hypothetical protein